MRRVIYTAIAGEYDVLKDPVVRSDGWDYICFTDTPELNSKTWEIRPLPADDSSVLRAKSVKIRPHVHLPEYNTSIWVDASYLIIDDAGGLAERLLRRHDMALFRHRQSRASVRDEGEACINAGKESRQVVEDALKAFTEDGFIDDQPIPQCGIIMRHHNEEKVVQAMDLWQSQIERHSPRDQLSFRYACWSAGSAYRLCSYKICKTYFHQYPHGAPFSGPPLLPSPFSAQGLKRWIRKKLV